MGEGGPDPTPATFTFRSAAPVERCGTLTHDETWTTEDISGVVLTCPLVIPAGLTLRVEGGLFVKSYDQNLAEPDLLVEPGGSLEAEGTASEPVVFTSLYDDSVGGDSYGEGTHPAPAAGDYTAAVTPEEGSTVELDHTTVRYALGGVSDAPLESLVTNSEPTAQVGIEASSFEHDVEGVDLRRLSVGSLRVVGSTFAEDAVGFLLRGSETFSANIEGTSVEDVEVGLAVGGGHVAFRGFISARERSIEACDWDVGCAVDASFVEWAGPGAPTTPGDVCGAVSFSPYLLAGTPGETAAGSLNCDGTPTPWEELALGQESFNSSIAHVRRECDELEDDVCELIQRDFVCLSAAWDIANSQLPFQLPNPYSGGEGGSDWRSGASLLGRAGAAWLSQSADSTIATIGDVASRGFQIVGLASTFATLADAYRSCA